MESTGEVILGSDSKVPLEHRTRFGKYACNGPRQKGGLFVSDEQHIRITNGGLCRKKEKALSVLNAKGTL